MAKNLTITNPAFSSSSPKGMGGGFNLAPQVNNFNSIFNTTPLDEVESRQIEKLLVDNFLPGKVSEEQVEQDSNQLKTITSEIKAISNQSIVLIGERIHNAREILKPYRDGALAQWIESTFGSRRTAYNILAYYQLYSQLSSPTLQDRFKKMPQKIAYLLASKDVDISGKTEIIENYYESNSSELMMLIQERFPADIGDGRRKAANKTLLDSLELGLKKICKRKDHLTEGDHIQITRLKKLIDEILESKNITVESTLNP